MDWAIRPQQRTQEQKSNGLLFPSYYLDFADDIALLSHSYKHAQEKVQSLATTSRLAGLKIKRSKTKVMRINNTREDPIKLENEAIEDVTSFRYLQSVIATDARSEQYVIVVLRINKARIAFLLLRPVWRLKEIFLRTKLRILIPVQRPS